MKMSKYDLCEKCRNLKFHSQTFGDYIDECLANRGGAFTNQMDFQLMCDMLVTNLRMNNACEKCISHFKRASGM